MRRNNTRFIITLLALLFVLSVAPYCIADDIVTEINGRKVVLHDDFTWEYLDTPKYDFDFSKIRDNEIPSFLRQGIKVDAKTITIAVEMYLQGWRYTMPSPKSKQAAWENTDGRTTWYYGYWFNEKTGAFSEETPMKKANGFYYGDDQKKQWHWRNGGAPRYPTKIEWLLSTSGGVKPRD